jgi:7-keto-8-aminopelargonate synthetase-like enzyme
VDEKREREVWARCSRFVTGFGSREFDPRTTLLGLAERLEERVAGLLGKEAAVWMPTGTMAQQIVLRVHARRTGRDVVAFHPLCHLDVHEERGY